MQEFEYTITKDVYDYIVCGKKKIEIRLYNEKSRKINIGDIIYFNVLDSTEKTKVRVVALLRYKNIMELLNDVKDDNIILNKSIDNVEEMFSKIMGEENVKSHDVLGIKFELLNE